MYLQYFEDCPYHGTNIVFSRRGTILAFFYSTPGILHSTAHLRMPAFT
jgi:hypothetical protein